MCISSVMVGCGGEMSSGGKDGAGGLLGIIGSLVGIIGSLVAAGCSKAALWDWMFGLLGGAF